MYEWIDGHHDNKELMLFLNLYLSLIPPSASYVSLPQPVFLHYAVFQSILLKVKSPKKARSQAINGVSVVFFFH